MSELLTVIHLDPVKGNVKMEAGQIFKPKSPAQVCLIRDRITAIKEHTANHFSSKEKI